VAPLCRATEIDGGNASYHGALGAAYRAMKRPAEALASFERALAFGPRSAELLNNVALARRDAGRREEALAAFDEALSIKPDYQTVHFNRGRLLAGMGRLDEAVAAFETAIRLAPGDAGTHCMLGVAHYDRADWEAAAEAFDRALEIHPNYAEARRNRAMVRLLHGEYERGWRQFEARLDCDDIVKRAFDKPRWDGSPLAGRTLFVYAEQGLGDTLQFVRYVPAAARAGGRVLFEAQDALRPLLVQSGFGEYLIERGEQPAFDVHASLISLARHVPDGSGAPHWPGQYLRADPERVEHWKVRLGDIAGFKVGIAWAGNPEHPHDRFRSVRLEEFAPLAAVPGVRLVSLQKGAGGEQRAEVAGRMNVVDLGGELDESTGAFMDTTAVIENLGLVISVDTAVAHLAGAMGAQVWLALQYAPDWRWRTSGETTAWYPTMRLFRQQSLNDWRPVFHEIATNLKRLIATLPARL
jgi:Tfp pilus assembly protein PilF